MTIVTIITAIFGSVIFGSVMAGYMKRKLYLIERFILALGAILMIRPKLGPTLLGIAVFGGVFAFQFIFSKHPKGYVVPETMKKRVS